MLPPRDAGYLLDILNAARAAHTYLNGCTFDAFLEDPQRQDAIIRRLEIIGEAARRVSLETRSSLLSLPWEQMIGIRNVLIHDYDNVDLDIVWDTVSKDLPGLIQELEKVVPPPQKNV
jgi:uncharacterized protein with HEPN domain